MPDQLGRQFGPYRLLHLLGRGGFAEVYLAEHVHLKMQAAVKVLYGPMTMQDVQAFTTEARTIAALRHPHILRILDFGFEQTLPFLAMEYAASGTLRDRHPDGSQVPLVKVISYVKQVSSALAYAHEKKLIHRDVKPENLLIDVDGNVLLGDFGIAAIAHSTTSIKTIDNTGTAHYMAPEQIKGQPRPASDQYALAIVVYEWLCGERPFTGDNPIEIAMHHLADEPPPLHTRGVTISPKIEAVILKALSKDPQQRFATILLFAEALERAYEEEAETKPQLHRLNPKQTKQEAQMYHEEAKKFINLGKYEEALTVLNQSLFLDATDAETYALKGFTLNQLERYEEALTSLNQALSLDSSCLRAYRQKSFAFNQCGRYEEALIVLDQLLDLDPTSAIAYARKGFALNELERYEEALTMLDQALTLDPNDDWVYMLKGFALNKLKRYEEALAVVDRALTLDPTNVQAKELRSKLLQKK